MILGYPPDEVGGFKITQYIPFDFHVHFCHVRALPEPYQATKVHIGGYISYKSKKIRR